MSKNKTDFGEPWQLTTDFAFDITIQGELAASFDKIEHANRAIACVNACAGMSDPAAKIKAMREAIKNIYYLTEGCADGAPDASVHDKLCNEIADKLQPFLKS